MSFAALGCLAAPTLTAAQGVSIDQVVSADTDREIVVEAQEELDPDDLSVREVKQQARSITQASNIFDESLPQFQMPLCPGVTGLPVDLATLIADRIRFNADRIGLRLAEAGECKPNLIVSFVLNGQKTLREMTAKRNTVLGSIPAREKQALLNDPGPVHVWQIKVLRTRDGMEVATDQQEGFARSRSFGANSLILQSTRWDIELAAVVIDIPAIDGMSAVQIADYATMRGLAKVRPVEGDPAFSTILNLFDEDSLHPMELTTFDVAYLKTLYERPPNIAAAAKLGTVRGEMVSELTAASAATDQESDE